MFLKKSRITVESTQTQLIKVTNNCLFYLKFGLSEKHTKFEKNLPHAFDIYKLSKCQKHEEDCANLCVLLRKSEL